MPRSPSSRWTGGPSTTWASTTIDDARIEDRYVEMLQPLLATGKPVIVTEFGMRSYRGANSSGTLGFGVTDTTRLWLHTRPVIGRLFRPR